MIFIDNESVTDPRINLAVEEYILQQIVLPDDILLFYINEPSIIIGRNQNTIEEINQDVVEKRGIKVVRRLSGGGAVYHDLGNLCFSFTMRSGTEEIANFKKFTAPVVRALVEMGVPAEMSGRNDILVDGRKVSGNASYRTSKGMVSHGTLLFKSDLDHLSDALRVKPGKIESKGIKSVRSRVANISEFLPGSMTVLEFREKLLQGIFAGCDPIPQYHLTESDWEGIHTLSRDRYQTWDWNYGRSPLFNIQKTHRFSSGEVDARIEVHQGMITTIRFFGDFFGQEDIGELERNLRGVRYDKNSIQHFLSTVDLNRFLAGVDNHEFLDFLV
jgi:lipoate---protein ligase